MSVFVSIYLIYLDSYYMLVANDSFALRKTFLSSHRPLPWVRFTDKMTFDQLLG